MKFRIILLTAIFLIFLSSVNAEIKVLTTVNDIYNINEKIPLQAELSYSQEQQGYIKANINCINKDLDYYVTPFNIKTSKQQVNIPELVLTKDMIGKCSLNILLTDLNNNLLDQALISLIDVSDKLNLDVTLSDYEIDPGKILAVKGTVKNIRNIPLDKSFLRITLDNNEYDYELNLPDFSQELTLDQKIKSGKHTVKVNVNDDYGNNAESLLEFNVIPKAVELKNVMNKLEFLPEETIEITSLLSDQANDLIENEAQIRLFNPKNNYITQGYGKIVYVLPREAPPGTWAIRTVGYGFNIESKFIVKEVKKIGFSIENGKLYIDNLGNVNYQDTIKISTDEEEFSSYADIIPGETKEIDLSKKLGQGTYDLVVSTSSEREKFSQVNVPKSEDPIYLTGLTAKKVTNNLLGKPYLLILLTALILTTIFLFNRNKNLQRMKREKEFQLGNVQLQKIRNEKNVGFKPKKFSEMSNEEMQDYRKQILKSMKEEKSKEENQGYQYKPPKEGKGLFSMFD